MAVGLLVGTRHKHESSRATQACNDYLRMGPYRSLTRLITFYLENDQTTMPTKARGTIDHWSSSYGWVARAEQYDTLLEHEKNERAREVMISGLALAHERVEKLHYLSKFLEEQIYEQDEDGNYPNVWLPDVKQIGKGESVERVDIVRFNASLIDQYRGTLDDLAKETGGRKLVQEIKGNMAMAQSQVVIVQMPSNDRGDET